MVVGTNGSSRSSYLRRLTSSRKKPAHHGAGLVLSDKTGKVIWSAP